MFSFFIVFYLTGCDSNDSNECNIKGNISYRTGEKIYHLPGDAYYDRTVIDESKGEEWFCTEDEAIDAGFRRSDTEKNISQQETDQEEDSVLKESDTSASNMEEQSNQENQELQNYKSYVFDMVNTNYIDLVGHMSNLTSSGIDVDIMDLYFDGVKIVYDSGFNSPPPGGEKIHQAGKDALKAILNMKPTITLKNGRCFATQKTSQSFSIVTNKMETLNKALTDN